MGSTSGLVFEKAACRYCSAEISVNSLERHETDCANASDELRAERKHAREVAEMKRRRNAQPRGTKQRTIPCKYCGELIGAGSLLRHELKCETRTPEERTYAKQQRAYQMAHYDRKKKSEDNRRRYQESLRVPSERRRRMEHEALNEPVVPTLPSNGTPMKHPMSISMTVDQDDFALALGRVVISKLPELLPQLIPGLTIGSFTTKSHRAGKV